LTLGPILAMKKIFDRDRVDPLSNPCNEKIIDTAFKRQLIKPPEVI